MSVDFGCDILVTGGGGLLGHGLRRMGLSDTVFVAREDGDLTNYQNVISIFEKYRPRRVIHAAAEVAGIGGNIIHSGEYYRNNILINTNVLECARVFQVERLISFMSTCIFPVDAPYPLNERDIHLGPPHPSNFGYAYAKRMLEVQTVAYRQEWQCDFLCAIPTNMYGPYDFWNVEESHVVPSLIHKCFQAKAQGEKLSVWGTGSPLREFVFIDDIARLVIWMLDNYTETSPLILSSGIETSIRELVEEVVSSIGFDGEVEWDSSKPDGQHRKPSDSAKLRKYLPDFAFTSVDDGVDETVKWFVNKYPSLRL